jgi:polyadenylate-binding protein
VKKSNTGELLPKGFVCFKDSEHAKKALDEMNKMQIEGNVLFVTKHLTHKELELQREQPNSYLKQSVLQQYSTNLFVKGLQDDLSED